MRTRMLTLSGIYQLKSSIAFEDAKRLLIADIKKLIDNNEFDNMLNIFTKESSVLVENTDEPKVELFVTMFVTVAENNKSIVKLFREYVNNNMTKLDCDNYSAKLIKKRIY